MPPPPPSESNQPLTTLRDIVAIDGPAGAGKSTIAKAVAQRLGMAFLDSGAMYRAATWWAMHKKVDMSDPESLAQSTAQLPLEMRYNDQTLQVLVDGHDVSEAIRTPEVTRSIRHLDGIQAVRTPLVQLQRTFAAKQPTVAEGRDMGTVVFPNARCKIFLDASLEERIRRRAEQLEASGAQINLTTLRDDIEQRDRNDTTRTVAPLTRADDAYLLDTTSRTIEEVVDTIVQRAELTA